MLSYDELIELLESNDVKDLDVKLDETPLENLFLDDDFVMDPPLAIAAVKFNSVILWDYLKRNNHDVNETDMYGLTTYNYLQLYWEKDTIDAFLDGSINEDHNLDESFRRLDEARKESKIVITEKDKMLAYQYTKDNYRMLFAKQDCVCIHCWSKFTSSSIPDYTLTRKGTALCPYCHKEAVIGEYSGYKLDDKFIEIMAKEYFYNEGDV